MGPGDEMNLQLLAERKADLEEALTHRFTSALVADDLTALVFQYAMYGGEARSKLKGDLAHLYHEHLTGFVHRGVEVTGAGTPQVDGWYHRREGREGPPGPENSLRPWTYQGNHRDAWHGSTVGGWPQITEGRHWYEKDYGCYIFWNSDYNVWFCCDVVGTRCFAQSEGDRPRSGESQLGFNHNDPDRPNLNSSGSGAAPAPTLRVVS